jgi:hypothetical protein
MESLRFTFVVDCPAEHAFAMWTAHTASWWPADHTTSGENDLDVVIEPHVGGRIFERNAAGTEIDWGEVTFWEPPRRIGYLWHLRFDRADATNVEIRFTDIGATATQVDIEHHGWERLGDLGPARRQANQHGWDTLLPWYVAACSRATPTAG